MSVLEDVRLEASKGMIGTPLLAVLQEALMSMLYLFSFLGQGTKRQKPWRVMLSKTYCIQYVTSPVNPEMENISQVLLI